MESDGLGLQSATREPVRQVAAVLRERLGDALVTLAAHGSAVKGGYIAGCSDLDLAVYVRSDALAADGNLSLARAEDLYRGLSGIDPAPFRYVQLYVHPPGQGPGLGLIPGAYHIVWGAPEVPLADAVSLLRSAHESLGRIDVAGYASRIGQHLLGWGRTAHHQELRWLCTDVWPALFHLLTLQSEDPLTVWRLAKPEAIARTDAASVPGQTIRTFYATLLAHYTGGEALEMALSALEAGLAFLTAAHGWYQAYQG